MIRSTIRVTGFAVVALAVPVLAVPAYAHVTASPDEADSPYFATALRVSHGCEGSPTTGVRVQVPEHVASMRPEVVPGWEIEIVEEDGVLTEVGWHGGSLPDEHFQEFGLSLQIGEDAPEVLWLPTIQECAEGEHRWIEIPSSVEEWDSLDEPAPYVQVAFGAHAGDGESGDMSDDAPADESAEEGDTDEEPGHGADDAEADVADAPGGSESDSAAAEDGSNAMPVAVIGLTAGVLGLAAGATALVRSARRG